MDNDDTFDRAGRVPARLEVEELLTLVVMHRRGVEVFQLTEGSSVVVGRAPPSDAIVPDPSVSRQHARFDRTDGSVFVQDLGSHNGTVVAGKRVEGRAPLAVGDEVTLGSIRVGLHVAASPTSGRGAAVQTTLDNHDRFIDTLDRVIWKQNTAGGSAALLMLRAAARDTDLVGWYPQVLSLTGPDALVAVYSPGVVEVLLVGADTHGARALFDTLTGQVGKTLRCGIAVCPDAATSSGQLMDVARSACRAASDDDPCVVGKRDGPELLGGRRLVETRSPLMQEVLRRAQRAAASDVSVLILGETGSGKEVVARAIHEHSARSARPLVSINCAAIPESLVESTFFGHEKGAFTGADRQAAGVFEEADGGTLFLDEVGELSPGAQVALLRALETKRVRRVGSSRETPVDVRVLAATNRDVESMDGEGAFRTDLLYRLNVVALRVPALRERGEDILPLAERFLEEASRASGGPARRLDSGARAALLAYGWPGNIRELRNAVEHAVVLAEGDEVVVRDLSERIRTGVGVDIAEGGTSSAPPPGLDHKSRIQQYEARLLIEALEAADWNQTRAAKQMGMPLRTLQHKIRIFGIKRP